MLRGLKHGLFGLVLSAIALPAGAQTLNCADRHVLVDKLETEHAETQRGAGLTADGRVIEIFASSSGAWTLLLTRPDGTACVVSYGEAWHLAPVKDKRPVS